MGRQGESRPVTRITFYSLCEQLERSGDPVLLVGEAVRKSTQVQIVGRQLSGRPTRRASRFGGLQCRLDDPGDIRRHLVLKLENFFQRTVEAVGPQMGARRGVDQLRSDP